LHRVLNESVEQQPTSSGFSSIESERVFIKVVVEMLVADSPLESAQKPTFEQGSDTMRPWQRHVSRISTAGEQNHIPCVTVLVDAVVAEPAIGTDDGTGFDRVADERRQAGGRHIRYTAQPHSPESLWRMDLDSDGDDGLLVRFTPANTSFLTTDIRFIYFYFAAETISPGANHGTSHLVEPSPGCLIASEPDSTLETERVPTEFLARYIPHCLEPSTKRLSCAFENRSCRNGCLTIARRAVHLLPRCKPGLTSSASRTDKPSGPSELFEISDTCSVRGKPLIEFLECTWVVHPAHWMPSDVAHHNILYQLERNGYPPYSINRHPLKGEGIQVAVHSSVA